MKNKKQRIRIIGLSLAILAVLATVIAIIYYNFGNAEKSAEELFPSFKNNLNIIENAEAKYSIVYSEFASDEVITAVKKISEEITKLTGTTLKTMYDSEAVDSKYIIVGETSLKDSEDAKSSLNNAADSFVITATTAENIVVISKYEDHIIKAAEYFVNNLLIKNYDASSSTLVYEGYYDKGKDKLPEGYNLSDLAKSKIVYATNLDGYRVVAEKLQNQIKKVYNIEVPIYSDEEKVSSAREILIGETNRGLSKSYYKNNGYVMEYDVVAQEGSLQILSGGSFSARKAAEELSVKLLKTADAKKELKKGSYTSKNLRAKDVPPQNGTNARLMTLNIMPYVLGEAAYANVLPVRERVEIFAGMLISHAPDAIGLQEADFKWQEQIPHYVEVLNEYYDLGYDFVLSTYNGKNVYCPVLYRADKYEALECEYQHYDYHTSSANSKGYYVRGAAKLVLQNKNNASEKFIVVNAHWDHGGQTTTANPQYMNECASSEAAIVNEYKMKYPGVRIFCLGDFNSHRYNGVFFKQFCDEIEGSVASAVAKASGTLKTPGGYHASGDKMIESGTRDDFAPTKDKFIDHLIFTCSDASVKTFVLSHDTLYKTDGYFHIISDHCPVYADFDFVEG